MVEEKRWRILVEGDAATDPLTAEDIVTRLWSSADDLLLWAERLQPGEGASPQDVLEVRRLLLEAEASRRSRFRRLLSGVWRSTIEEDVWQGVKAARAGEPGIDDD
jgi:hypothetical protein